MMPPRLLVFCLLLPLWLLVVVVATSKGRWE